MPTRRPLVVVIGAGFAGLKAVQGLRRALVDVLLVDRHNYHLFQPLLYQVATAALSPGDIAYPIRRVFRSQRNVEVAMTPIDSIDLAHSQIASGDARTTYDYLVVAVGATHSYFGHEDWASDAPGLKTIDDAIEIRKRVLLAFEEAEHEADPDSQRAKLTFIVVGGGPTGVEMAGALREIASKYIPRDFRHIDTTTSRIILLEGGDRLLGAFPAELGDRAKRDLEAMKVEVRLNSRATRVGPDRVWIGDEQLSAANIIWAAGVQAPTLLKSMGVEQDRSGRVVVKSDLSVPGHPNVFVIGDAAHAIDAGTGKPVPGLAPAAMQMGRYVARLILDETTERTTSAQRQAFEYLDKGALATIGIRRAVADIRGYHFGGLIAWLLWCIVHLTFLITFRNKLYVMMGWIYAYVFNKREVRLITGKVNLDIHTLRSRTPETPAPEPVEAK